MEDGLESSPTSTPVLQESPQLAGRRTRGIVLDLIRSFRRVSRVELIAASGFTGATISTIVRDLISDGLVVETGQIESTGGKRRTVLELNSSARYTVGVQFDRCRTVIVLTDLAGSVVVRTALGGSGDRAPREMMEVVACGIDALIEQAQVPRTSVLGIGVATHGPQDRSLGRLMIAQPTPEWQGFPLVLELEKLVSMPVLLENDATAAAIGEYWVGGVPATSTYGSIYMSTGIGGGVVVDGDVYRGRSSNGVEIGHISLDVNGRLCGCGNRGCVENFAGPTAVINSVRHLPDLAQRLGITDGPNDILINFERIANAALSQDNDARAIIEQSARYLGHAAVTLANLFDLELIVLGGPSFEGAGPIYLAIMQQELDNTAFLSTVHPARVVLSRNGADAGAIGGASLVLRSELTPLGHRRSAR